MDKQINFAVIFFSFYFSNAMRCAAFSCFGDYEQMMKVKYFDCKQLSIEANSNVYIRDSVL